MAEDVYLSADATRDASDKLIGNILVETGSSGFSIPLPCAIVPGTYYLILSSGVVSSSTVTISGDPVCYPVQYTIGTVPGSGVAGQQYTFPVTITGGGTQPVSEKVYLSSTTSITTSGVYVADVIINSTTTELQVTLPGATYGQYYIGFLNAHKASANSISISMPLAVPVAVSGSLYYEKPAVTAQHTLSSGTVYQYPAAMVKVQLLDLNGSVLTESRSLSDGSYSLSGNPHGYFKIRMVSESVDAGGKYAFYVVNRNDTTTAGSTYSVDSSQVDASCGNACSMDLTALYSNRGSGPFAILDLAHKFEQVIHGWKPGLNLSALYFRWQPNGTQGTYFVDGSSSCPNSSGKCVYLLGNASVDSDEYDSSVVAHELNHFMETEISRIDSPGGYHTFGDYLDPRLAFSEGMANAMSAAYSGNAVYEDTNAVAGFTIDLESMVANPTGYYSEETVTTLVYDFLDGGSGDDDTLTYGPSAILQAMSDMKNTDGIIWIHEFLRTLKINYPGDVASIDSLAGSAGIAASPQVEGNVVATVPTALVNTNYTSAHTCDGSTEAYAHTPSIKEISGAGRFHPFAVSLRMSQWCGNLSYGSSNKLFGSAFFQLHPTNSGTSSVFAREGSDTYNNYGLYTLSNVEVIIRQNGVQVKKCTGIDARRCRFPVVASSSYLVELHLDDRCLDGLSCDYYASGPEPIDVLVDLPPDAYTGPVFYTWNEVDAWNAHNIFITDQAYSGNLGGVAGADEICRIEADDGRASIFTGQYKALLVDGVNRTARSGAQVDWVLSPMTYYHSLDGIMGVTDANALMPIPPLKRIYPSVLIANYWTGMDNTNWGTAPWSTSTYTCNKWTYGKSTLTYMGTYGYNYYMDSKMYAYTSTSCNIERNIACVQQ